MTRSTDTLRLLKHALPYKFQLGGALLLALFGASLEVARPWPTKVIVDYALTGLPMPPWLLGLAESFSSLSTSEGIIFWSLVAAASLVIGSAIVALLAEMMIFAVAQKMVMDLSGKVFSKLQRLSLTFHQRQAVGDLTQRAGSDVFVVQAAVCAVAIPAIASVVALLGMMFVMVRLDPVLAFVSISMVPLLLLALVGFKKPMTAAGEQQWKTQGEMMAFLEQSLGGIRLIQGYARESHIENVMARYGKNLANAYQRSLWVGAGFNKVTLIITGVVSVVLLGVGGLRVLEQRITLGDLLVFMGYVVTLTGPVTAIATAISTAAALNSRGRRVLEILDSTEEIPERDIPVLLARVRGEIQFDSVTFAYPHGAAESASSNVVLSDISFRAEAGQVTAIIGVTGAGKSSLVSLLSRYYDPVSGSVSLDGHDLRDLSLRALREAVAIVSQDPVLFPISVAENIEFGRAGASREEVIAAAKMARAHDFIVAFPSGYDTQLAERGNSLSGGERQRISLARALLKDSPILVLDEPTSSLDAHTESQIFASLSQWIKGKTTFIISHRLSTIRRADQIISIENGRIVERGTHEILVGGSGVYSRLFESQNIAVL
jgi:ABC-type multidrug transport system fused ATPase/permease subunit